MAGMPDDWIYDPTINKSRKRHPWEMFKPTGDDKEKEEYKPFPISNKVYHFHPIAFVEQMVRMDTGLRYEIYYTGEIKPFGDYEKAKEVSFIYHDKNGGKHDLGKYKLIEVEAYENGKKKSKLKKGEDLAVYKKVYSSKYGYLYYKKLNKKIKTLDITQLMVGNKNGAWYEMLKFNYNKNGLELIFYAQTERRYAQPKCFASLIGAIIDSGYIDIKINGFTSNDKDGKSFIKVKIYPNGTFNKWDKDEDDVILKFHFIRQNNTRVPFEKDKYLMAIMDWEGYYNKNRSKYFFNNGQLTKESEIKIEILKTLQKGSVN